ncbi:MAG: hypothetical protein EB060_12830, partial [Proteobacteria bacterium]|nr:hypothetical protein [Pseudomonadota bacterium]
GTFADKNAGTSKVVTATGFALAGADGGNYSLAQPAGLTATITPRPVTAALAGGVSKAYDGTTFATLAPANYTLSGTLAGDSVLLNSPAVGTYDSKAIGTNKAVTATGLSLVGGDAANYQLSATTLSAAIGTITKKLLTVLGVTAADKTYDGTTAAGRRGRRRPE